MMKPRKSKPASQKPKVKKPRSPPFEFPPVRRVNASMLTVTIAQPEYKRPEVPDFILEKGALYIRSLESPLTSFFNFSYAVSYSNTSNTSNILSTTLSTPGQQPQVPQQHVHPANKNSYDQTDPRTWTKFLVISEPIEPIDPVGNLSNLMGSAWTQKVYNLTTMQEETIDLNDRRLLSTPGKYVYYKVLDDGEISVSPIAFKEPEPKYTEPQTTSVQTVYLTNDVSSTSSKIKISL